MTHSRQKERQVRLCEMFGLDPKTTTNLYVEWDAGPMPPVVHWEGRQFLTEDQIKALGELLYE